MSKQIRLLIVTMLSVVLAACGSSSPVAPAAGGSGVTVTPAPSGMPQTIPALRKWQAGTGAFQFNEGSRIVIASADQAVLRPVAEVFAEDLLALTGRPVAVVDNASSAARAGDVSLRLGESDPRVGREGYRMTAGATLEITAAEAAGAFYGTRSVLQLLHQGSKIPAGEALDWPRYPERGLAIDASNNFYTARWIEAHLRELAYLKMNIFQLHFSDNGGFRLESTTHPEIVSADHLSKQEIAGIVALASRYHITVVPDLDVPGHMGGALAAHPEFQLGPAATDKLDITNPAAEQFVRELMEEYLPLFPGPYWAIYADEYLPAAEVPLYPQLKSDAQARYGANANAKDALLGFVNRLDELVRAHGKTARLANDELGGGSAVAVNTDMIVEWWTDISPLSDPVAPKAQALLDQGYTIMNISSNPTYYNAGTCGLYIPTADMQSAYEHWEVNRFSGSVFGPSVGGNTVQLPPEVISPDEPRNLGAKVFVWCGGESEASVADKIFPRLRVITQKAWDSPPLVAKYAEFQQIMDAIGHAPGYAIQ